MSLPRHDLFQTDFLVTLTIFKKGCTLDDCKVSFSSRQITVRTGEDVIFVGELGGEVKKDEITVKVTPSKVEVGLPKEVAGRWNNLIEKKEEAETSTVVRPDGGKKNWDKIEKEAVKEEEEEETTGDAAVHKMFKKIYGDANDDVKKAMMKSYQESGGTVLSTNWAEIGSKKTEVKAPDSMEYKKFEQ
ncbi:hypothetical protein PRIPAC_94753 [Pristionchus pacificus]|uniref:SGS domain-containing protein n=1 Tax=Pristionchus pacificus TaxID=54126 RepID=A0A8R1Z8Q9_PRIPA|nr:hypothetical protein PRIPAC_94753 [Pristionchus pacificus]